MLRALLLLGGLAAFAAGCNDGPDPTRAPAAPIEVGVVAASERAIPNRFDFIGTVEPLQRVELQARVRGYVTDIGFEEGTTVDAGQVLFEIDTRPLRAEERAATAGLRRARAQLDEARRRLARERSLVEAGVSSAEQLDAVQAEVDALQAQVGEQRASREQAALDVGYSRIRAPFRGRVGERLVDVGALVGDGGATPLAVVVQEDPVLVRFSPTERERRELLALDPGLEEMVSEGQRPVYITLSDGTTLERPGLLTFVGNALDPTTRSLLYKATVPNLAPALKPGESVTAVLEMPPSEGVVVPAVAVASVQDVDYVYVVDEDGVVDQREVELGPMVGSDRVIASGLAAGEPVIVRGIQRVRDGARVTVVERPTATAAVGGSRDDPVGAG